MIIRGVENLKKITPAIGVGVGVLIPLTLCQIVTPQFFVR